VVVVVWLGGGEVKVVDLTTGLALANSHVLSLSPQNKYIIHSAVLIYGFSYSQFPISFLLQPDLFTRPDSAVPRYSSHYCDSNSICCGESDSCLFKDSRNTRSISTLIGTSIVNTSRITCIYGTSPYLSAFPVNM